MCECKRCGRELTSLLSIKRGYGKVCYSIVQIKQVNDSILDDLLNRVRKLELDNNFMKHQLKHKTFTSKPKDAELDWDIPQEVKEAKNEYKIEFNIIIKELRIVLNTNGPILEKDFRFDDEDLGIKTIDEILYILN